MDAVLAIDIGASAVKVGVKGFYDKEISLLQSVSTGGYWTTIEVLEHIVSHLPEDIHLVAFGAGVACVVHDNGLTGERSSNMSDWTCRHIRTDLQNKLGIPGIVVNDCKMGGIGACAALCRPLVYVGLGTGVGVSNVDGSPATNIRAHATEFGHHTVDSSPDALKCGCGGKGHWEAYSGGAHLESRWGCPPAAMTDAQWSRQLQIDAIGLRNTADAYPGKPIVLGGGRFWRQRHRLSELQTLVCQLQSPSRVPELLPAPHGMHSALFGAAFTAWKLAKR